MIALEASPTPPDRVVVMPPTVFDNGVAGTFGTQQFLPPLSVVDGRCNHTPSNPAPSIRGIPSCTRHQHPGV